MQSLLTRATVTVIATFSAMAVWAATPNAIDKLSCGTIDAAISSTEDFAEAALMGDRAGAQTGLAKIRKTFFDIAYALTKEQNDVAERQIGLVERAVKVGDFPLSALYATDIYSSLSDAFDKRLPAPIEVAMLDYAGFRVHALLAQKTIDWAAIKATAQQATTNWTAVKNQIKNKALIDLGNTLHDSLAAAASSENYGWLKSMAQMELDSVDLLEKNVTSTSKLACR